MIQTSDRDRTEDSTGKRKKHLGKRLLIRFCASHHTDYDIAVRHRLNVANENFCDKTGYTSLKKLRISLKCP